MSPDERRERALAWAREVGFPDESLLACDEACPSCEEERQALRRVRWRRVCVYLAAAVVGACSYFALRGVAW